MYPSNGTLGLIGVVMSYVVVIGLMAFRRDRSNTMSEHAKLIRERAIEDLEAAKLEARGKKKTHWQRLAAQFRWILLTVTLAWEFIQYATLTFNSGTPWPEEISEFLRKLTGYFTGEVAVLIFVIATTVVLTVLVLYVVLEFRTAREWMVWAWAIGKHGVLLGWRSRRVAALAPGAGEEVELSAFEESNVSNEVSDRLPTLASLPPLPSADHGPGRRPPVAAGPPVASGSGSKRRPSVATLPGGPSAGAAGAAGAADAVAAATATLMHDEMGGEGDDDAEDVDAGPGRRWLMFWHRHHRAVYEFMGTLFLEILFMPIVRLALEICSCRALGPNGADVMNLAVHVRCWTSRHLGLLAYALVFYFIVVLACMKYNLSLNTFSPDFQYLPRFSVMMACAEIFFVVLTTMARGLTLLVVLGVSAGMTILFVSNTLLQPCVGEGAISNHWRSASFAGAMLLAYGSVAQFFVNDKRSYTVLIAVAASIVPAMIGGYYLSKHRSTRMLNATVQQLSRLNEQEDPVATGAVLDAVSNLVMDSKTRRYLVTHDALPKDLPRMLGSNSTVVQLGVLRLINSLCLGDDGRLAITKPSLVLAVLGCCRSSDVSVTALALRSLTKLAQKENVSEHLLEQKVDDICTSIVRDPANWMVAGFDRLVSALHLLAVMARVAEAKERLIKRNARHALRILSSMSDHPDVLRGALLFISNASSRGPESNRLELGRLGAVQTILETLRKTRTLEVKRLCLVALANLCTSPGLRAKISRSTGLALLKFTRSQVEGVRQAAARLMDVLHIAHDVPRTGASERRPSVAVAAASVSAVARLTGAVRQTHSEGAGVMAHHASSASAVSAVTGSMRPERRTR